MNARRQAGAALLAVVFLLAGPRRSLAAARPLECRGCDVILVTIDILRADELAAGGARREIMPRLDALAAAGAYFSQAYSPSPDSTPANVSIASGLYSWRHGVRVPLRDRAAQRRWAKSPQTLPGVLERNGYRVYSADAGELDVARVLGKDLDVGGPLPGPGPAAGKPYFLLLRSSVHDPYFSPRGTLAAVGNRLPEDRYPSREDVLKCDLASLLAGRAPASRRGFDRGDVARVSDPQKADFSAMNQARAPDARRDGYRPVEPALYPLQSQCFWSFFSTATLPMARLMYDAKARWVDDQVGAFLDRLGAHTPRKTLIVVTSQHGDEFLEHGHVAHAQQVYGDTLLVPLIFDFPGLKAGRRVPATASTVDVMPTVLSILGLEVPKGLDGRSLLPCLSGPCADRAVYSEFNGALAVRDERYSYLRLPQADGRVAEELFDRRTDPGEREDISGRGPAPLARLRREALEVVDWKQAPPGEWPDWADEKMRDEIIRTGYW